MDLTETIAPKSDQLNAEDLLTGPRTFTVEKVTKGSAEQPVDIHLVEFPGRPFRPSKTVRRILVNAWGPDANAYTGRRMTLYRDPAVKFGGMDVGGIRVSHLSHIDKPLSVALTVTRGKRQAYKVLPLADAPAPARSTAGDFKDGGDRERYSNRMFALFGEREAAIPDRLAFCSDVVGRALTTSKELTTAELLTVCDAVSAVPKDVTE